MYRAARGNVSHSYSENWKSCSASLSFVSKELSIRIFFEAMTARVPPRNGYWLTPCNHPMKWAEYYLLPLRTAQR